MEIIKLKSEEYLESRLNLLTLEKDKLEKEVSAAKTEIEETENKISELKKDVDEAYDVFSPKNSQDEFSASEINGLGNKIAGLCSENTEKLEIIRQLELEISKVEEAKTEVVSFKKNIVLADSRKDEIKLVDISKTDYVEKQNENPGNTTNSKSDIESSPSKEQEKYVGTNKESENIDLSNMDLKSLGDVDLLLDRLKLCKGLVGTDNHRVTTILLQLIDKLEK